MSEMDIHSKLIVWLKVALPLVALAILSTLFLVARTVDPEMAIPYAEVDVAERLREPRMTEPAYAGITSDGSALTVQASEARPEQAEPNSGSARNVVAGLETPDGRVTKLTSLAARIDGAANQIEFSGSVQVTSPGGWKVQSERMVARMDRTEIEVPTDVMAKGPAGTVTAKSMRLSEKEAGQGDYVLVFKGDVKLIYLPPH